MPRLDVRQVDLAKLNSLTKYPSIPTYHPLDPSDGSLLDEPMPMGGPVLLTEKIDSTNARVICFPDGTYLIGSRGELLYARGDLIGNPALGIVEALKPLAERMAAHASDATTGDEISVYYGEVYGGKVTGASKQYTGHRRVGYRLFDVARMADVHELLERPASEISSWREGGGQAFVDEAELGRQAEQLDLRLTPRLGETAAAALPTSLETTLALLEQTTPKTRSALDVGAGGTPEGLVLRTPTRSRIAKARFGDYRRTLKRRR